MDGETHFLRACRPDCSDCGGGLLCLHGLCTLPCTESDACQRLSPSADCVDTAGSIALVCSDRSITAACDLPCTADGDCASLSGSPRCLGGYCRYGSAVGPGGAGGVAGTGGVAGAGAGAGGAAGAGGVAGAAGAGGCPDSGVTGADVMVLGDMFLWQDRLIPTALEALARSAGALATGEQYRNYTSGTANSLALGGRLIAQQYATGWSEGPARVVIMDGGGTDVLVGTCPEPPTVDCPILVDAVAAADELLGQMGADGVEDVIWVGYPGPADAVLRAKMELLQPLLQGVCAGSVVPCHWVDLEPAFADHYAEYMAADAIPTAAGADVAAAEIWSVMQRRCVAQ